MNKKIWLVTILSVGLLAAVAGGVAWAMLQPDAEVEELKQQGNAAIKAKKLCAAASATLATISSRAENDFAHKVCGPGTVRFEPTQPNCAK